MVWVVGSIVGPRPRIAWEAMKHFAFLAVCTVIAMGYGLFAPFVIVAWYYFLALVRPQFVWGWSLSGEVRWSLIAGLAAIAAVVLNLGRYIDRLRPTPMMWLTIVFGVLVLLSGVNARDPGVAMPWVMEYGKILVMALILCLVLENLSYVRWLMTMVLGAMTYVAWSVNRDYLLTGYDLRVFEHGYGGLDNNGAGLLLAVGVPMAYAMMRPTGGAAWRWGVRAVGVVGGLLMLHGVMLTYSRGAMVALTMGLAWMAFRHKPRRQGVAVAGVLVLVVLAMAGQEVRDEYLSTTEYHEDPTAQLRFDSWNAAWRIAMDHPVLGVGVRNANLYSENYGSDRYGRTIHNQYLQTAADIGIPAMLVFCSILGASLWALHRTRRIAETALKRAAALDDHDLDEELRETRHMSVGLEAAIVTFSVGAMFLSLETFEFAWLILVVGATLPRLTERRVERAEREASERDAEAQRSVESDDDPAYGALAGRIGPRLPHEYTPV